MLRDGTQVDHPVEKLRSPCLDDKLQVQDRDEAKLLAEDVSQEVEEWDCLHRRKEERWENEMRLLTTTGQNEEVRFRVIAYNAKRMPISQPP